MHNLTREMNQRRTLKKLRKVVKYINIIYAFILFIPSLILDYFIGGSYHYICIIYICAGLIIGFGSVWFLNKSLYDIKRLERKIRDNHRKGLLKEFCNLDIEEIS